MKTCKKVLSFLLALIFVVTIMPTGIVEADSADGFFISVSDTTATPGSTATVTLTAGNNPGILGMTLNLNYDDTKATLTSVVNGDTLSYAVFTAPHNPKNGCALQWDAQDVRPEDIKDGVIATLTFELSDTVESGEELGISVSYANGAIIDNDMQILSPDLIEGKIQIIDYIPGDINGDGIVNSTDVVFLRRFIAGYAVTINEDAGDVNADGVLNSTDVVFIRRSIAGYPVMLKPAPIKCDHTMEEIPYKAATCTEAGNARYYHCTTCSRYYNDISGRVEIAVANTVLPALGHDEVTDPYVAPTYDSVGYTEGKHCDREGCGLVIVAQQEIPKLQKENYAIEYHIADNDVYLRNYIESTGYVNPNPDRYTSQDGLSFNHNGSTYERFIDLTIPGYDFIGWFDGAGSNATQIRTIPVGEKGNKQLYAHWQKTEYEIHFEGDFLGDVVQVPMKKYTVDIGATLPNISVDGYYFIGWTYNGNLTGSRIPAGTTGNLILKANWTSLRYLTRANSTPILLDTSLDESTYTITAIYDLGTIENIPMYNLAEPFQVTKGFTKSETVSSSSSMTDEAMKALNSAVEETTTMSSSWTLSNEWQQSSSYSQEHFEERGFEFDTAVHSGTVNQSDFSLSTEQCRSDSRTVTTGGSVKLGAEYESQASLKLPLKIKGIGLDLGASKKLGFSAEGEVHNEVEKNTTSSWNTKAGIELSKTQSTDVNVSNKLSQTVNDKTSYSISNAVTQGRSSTEESTNAVCKTNGYSSQVRASTMATEEKSLTINITTDAVPGWYRAVCAGTAHVFGVVNYDMRSSTYYLYTYSIMDDNTYTFLDYSRDTAQFNDRQNGVLPFTVPADIMTYVVDQMGATDGLIIDENGVVVEYNGDAVAVAIPNYYSVDNQDNTRTVVKVTGISKTAFSGNEELAEVILNDFITEIPDGAFEGCTALQAVSGGNLQRIGENAFAGCALLQPYSVPSTVAELGNNAFNAVNKVTVKAASSTVAMSAINSGAKNITVDMYDSIDSINGSVIAVPEGTESFELLGAGKTYSGTKIISGAKTILNYANFDSIAGTAIDYTGSDLTLNRITVSASGWALLMKGEQTRLTLDGDSTLRSTRSNAVLGSNVSVEQGGNLYGTLHVDSDMLYRGSISGEQYIECSGQLRCINDEEYNALKARWEAGTYTISLDANGGTLGQTTIDATCYEPIGELPVPTKDYHNFAGWFTEAEGGVQYTEATEADEPEDITLYAHWTLKELSGWVAPGEVPEGAETVNTKWVYTRTTSAESTGNTMEGFTQIGSRWEQTATGSKNYASFPSGFDTGHWIYRDFLKAPYTASETETTKREVSNNWAGYVYWHWMYDCGEANGTDRRAIYNKKATAENNFYYKYFGAFTSTKGDYSSDTGYCNSLGIRNYIIPERKAYADCQGATRWFRFDYSTTTYTDYVKVYQYQKVEQLTSEVEITESSAGGVVISNVYTLVQYRAK